MCFFQALAGAKQVHTFDRSADETISWILEKDNVLSNEDYGHDLETIQALVRRHEGFEVSWFQKIQLIIIFYFFQNNQTAKLWDITQFLSFLTMQLNVYILRRNIKTL